MFTRDDFVEALYQSPPDVVVGLLATVNPCQLATLKGYYGQELSRDTVVGMAIQTFLSIIPQEESGEEVSDSN